MTCQCPASFLISLIKPSSWIFYPDPELASNLQSLNFRYNIKVFRLQYFNPRVPWLFTLRRLYELKRDVSHLVRQQLLAD